MGWTVIGWTETALFEISICAQCIPRALPGLLCCRHTRNWASRANTQMPSVFYTFNVKIIFDTNTLNHSPTLSKTRVVAVPTVLSFLFYLTRLNVIFWITSVTQILFSVSNSGQNRKMGDCLARCETGVKIETKEPPRSIELQFCIFSLDLGYILCHLHAVLTHWAVQLHAC